MQKIKKEALLLLFYSFQNNIGHRIFPNGILLMF